MKETLIELCPICIEKYAENYTECGHQYCISCLCRIKKCAMCRNPLQRVKICIEIKSKVKFIDTPSEKIKIVYVNNTMTEGINLSSRIVNIPQSERFSESEGSYFNTVRSVSTTSVSTNEGINIYSFSLRPEQLVPSGYANISYIDPERQSQHDAVVRAYHTGRWD